MSRALIFSTADEASIHQSVLQILLVFQPRPFSTIDEVQRCHEPDLRRW